ncbi:MULTISPECIES: 3'(2'),5'-bisphosphate nucleotidase CysQ [Halomonas]|uniref:3'(2'),5'-bisphosphate nucleotidase CysQ n=1 Tax=Halomonas halophila TaxID=29573 RepID=A0ABQ0TZR8_9GAMM|nr:MULTISPECIES: 3'(2'),5'-bisphosphate nucleotidase CysQ [Halomonas]MDR5888350.1 3'(2'),5'-bisphosphate nucleotidase CysQ [Halomonas salina]WJY08860.1 3'(2'),5'-bisphosphate nucleotidase CysQ [Halomonas halophila]GEK71783.1 3'(2'),5'-bisphosphate nucleotidase CysQ [Halomonas halophila]
MVSAAAGERGAFVTPAARERLLAGVEAAGEAVMAIYRRPFDVETKADDSPVTEADLCAHHALVDLLGEVTPAVPVLSEESEAVPYATRRTWQRYWLVDPLDGTKEFIRRSGDFTLNVALIEDGVPTFGIVHAPTLGVSWFGQLGEGAWRREAGETRAIGVRPLPDPAFEAWRVMGSRSHGLSALASFLERLPCHALVSRGSSLKLCLVAEGSADLYPRFGPTSEWDTAAAQAVVTAAGGQVLDAGSLKPLRCNRHDSLLNPAFIACGERDPRWERALAESLVEGD